MKKIALFIYNFDLMKTDLERDNFLKKLFDTPCIEGKTEGAFKYAEEIQFNNSENTVILRKLDDLMWELAEKININAYDHENPSYQINNIMKTHSEYFDRPYNGGTTSRAVISNYFKNIFDIDL